MGHLCNQMLLSAILIRQPKGLVCTAAVPVTSTPLGPIPAQTYKTSMLRKGIKGDTQMPNRLRKQNGEWLLNGSESYATITRNNNTIEVSGLVSNAGTSHVTDFSEGVLAEMSSNKSDRSMSPSTLSEEGRRELIARQHRALYGAENPAFAGQVPFTGDDAAGRDQGIAVPPGTAGAVRGPSPRGIDPFGIPGQAQQGEGNMQGAAPGQDGSRIEKAASPSAQASSGFGNLDASVSSSGKAPTPPSGEESSHSRQISKSTTAPVNSGMAPIGSRPNNQQAPNQSLNKRTTSPLPPSLGYGFGSSEQNADRANSANSASNAAKESSGNPGTGAWGTGSGVWGSNKIGTTSVWG